jgi:hypothetical protein
VPVRVSIRAARRAFELQFQNFSSRQLNDTRYASRLAAEYLALLYGGKTDETDRLRVQVGAGQLTSLLRSEWGLDFILGAGEKTREDPVREAWRPASRRQLPVPIPLHAPHMVIRYVKPPPSVGPLPQGRPAWRE